MTTLNRKDLSEAIDKATTIWFWTAGSKTGLYVSVSQEEARRRTDGISPDDLMIFETKTPLQDCDNQHRGLYLGLHSETRPIGRIHDRWDVNLAIDEIALEVLSKTQESLREHALDRADDLIARVGGSREEAVVDIVQRVRLHWG